MSCKNNQSLFNWFKKKEREAVTSNLLNRGKYFVVYYVLENN